ncbi:hypothetical protein QJQ45_023985 [Haematococcus lacustris]|nr:hypothetical protein QJQ45_023985 [Haematococcus lacustris]
MGSSRRPAGGMLGRTVVCLIASFLTSLAPCATLSAHPPRSHPPPTPNAQHEASTSQRMQAESRVQREEVVGDLTYHPSFGLFPQGCKWRNIVNNTDGSVTYEFWDDSADAWAEDRPAACTPTGMSPDDVATAGWQFHQGTPRSEVGCDSSHCMYHNLYYNNGGFLPMVGLPHAPGRWFALVDGPMAIPTWRFSRNQEVVALHVQDVAAFMQGVEWRVIPGDTILFDFVFFIHPTAIGHWCVPDAGRQQQQQQQQRRQRRQLQLHAAAAAAAAGLTAQMWEMLGPLYSLLKTASLKRPCDQFILLHLQRQHLFEWVRAMIAVTLGVAVDGALPPVYLQEPTDNAWSQITQNLEGLRSDTWYVFERVAITKDLYTGGGRTFLTQQDAREFRAAVYSQYGLPPPAPRSPIPRVITFQRKRANRRILNEPDLLKLLARYGQLQVVEYNSSSSLYQQLLQMQGTGLLVSVHTSNLANAPLLQPGSAVLELLHVGDAQNPAQQQQAPAQQQQAPAQQHSSSSRGAGTAAGGHRRNWHWNGLDTSFRDQTHTMGDIHHYAWRAQFLNQTRYLDPREEAKVAHWPASQCGTEECVEAHTRVDVLVDLDEVGLGVRALLDSRLPLVWAGKAVREATLPWPMALDVPEDNVIPA